MLWDDFLQKLKSAKDAGKLSRYPVAATTTLIYSGAFDGMIQESKRGNPLAYKEMYENVTKILKSKATLPKARVTETIGLSSVDGPLSLAIWRHQSSPLSSLDIVSGCKEQLKQRGFESCHSELYEMIRPKVEKNPKSRSIHLTKKPGAVLSHQLLFSEFESSKKLLAIIGIISDVEIKPYGDGKERLVFRLFTGGETTAPITQWPDDSGKINESVKSAIKNGDVGYAIATPRIWEARNILTYNLLGWYSLKL